jgi:hypothetical protein
VKRTSSLQHLLYLPLIFFCLIGTSHAAGVTLAWDANPEADVAGYRLYYQTNSTTVPLVGNTALEGPSPIDVGDRLTFTLNGLDASQIHYFAVTAYDQKNVESTLSEIVASRWVPAARTPEKNSLVTPDRVVFQWTTPPGDTRIVGYRLYYSTDPDQLASAVSSGLAQAMGGGALAAGVALLGIGFGRAERRHRWLVLAMLAALTGAYGCSGGGGDDSPGPIDHRSPVAIAGVNVVTGLVENYHAAFDLEPSTTYFWKVVAIGEDGLEIEGATYSFTTEKF